MIRRSARETGSSGAGGCETGSRYVSEGTAIVTPRLGREGPGLHGCQLELLRREPARLHRSQVHSHVVRGRGHSGSRMVVMLESMGVWGGTRGAGGTWCALRRGEESPRL